MRKISLIIGVSMAWVAVVSLAAPDIDSANPAFQFGTVDNTETINHTFEVSNKGDAPLLISQVKPSCGCTIAKISSKNLQPGAVATIEAALNLKNRSGAQYKTISVYSNDPDQPVYQLKMTGTAVPEIAITPMSVSFGVIPAGTSDVSKLTRKIVVSTEKERPFKILSVTAMRKQVDTTLTTIEEGRKYEIDLQVKEQDFAGGMLRETLSIRTDSPTSPVLSVPVYATIRDLLTIIPNPLKLSSAVKAPVTRYITVRGGSVQNFEVLSAECSDCSDDLNVVLQNKGRYGYRIQLNNLMVDKVSPGQSIIVKTNIAGKETIEIPIEVVDPVTLSQPVPVRPTNVSPVVRPRQVVRPTPAPAPAPARGPARPVLPPVPAAQ